MPARMSFGQIDELEFSSLLQALSASAKGRLFLAEYRRRTRPEETFSLLDSLSRIEATISSVRDQLQPERIGDELRHIAMTLEIALDGAVLDPEGAETARRMALIDRARSELITLAGSLVGEVAPPPLDPSDAGAVTEALLDAPGLIEDGLAFLDHPADAEPADER